MATLTKIGGKTHDEYKTYIIKLKTSIADLENNSKRTWQEFGNVVNNYFFNQKKFEEEKQKIQSDDDDLINAKKELADAEICNYIFEFNINNRSSQILNPIKEWENSSMPYEGKEKIRAYIREYKHPPISFLFTTTTTGSTIIDYPDGGGGNKKTNSKKYRKYRRKSHKKSHKKSHRKYNK